MNYGRSFVILKAPLETKACLCNDRLGPQFFYGFRIPGNVFQQEPAGKIHYVD